MDANLIAAFQRAAFVKATLVRLDMAGGAVGLTDGGIVVFVAGEGDGPEPYISHHPVYGALAALPAIKDGAEAQTTRIDLTLLPASDTAAAVLASPTTQGTRVQWWEGAVDPESGLLIGVPELKFEGEIDKARFQVSDSWSLTLECGTQAERQLEPNADWRLNNGFHQLIWPGELGMSFVDGVTRKKEWRSRPENPGVFKRMLKSLVPFLPD